MTSITGIININSMKWGKLHIFFFYLFLFSIPFQARKVFLTQYSFYSDAFTEYTTFFIYASDVFLALALFFWLISVKHKTEFITHLRKQITVYFSSFVAKSYLSLLSHIKVRNKLRQEFIATINYISRAKHRAKHKTIKHRKIQLLLFLFIIWLIINTIINNNYLEISVFQIIKFIELFLLLAYIYFNLINKKILLTSLFVIPLTGFLQGLIAIYQFIFQHSLFNSLILAKITGEIAIGPQIPGIAKIVIDGEKIIRAYGTFPHSNVLGGFLIFSTIISIYLLLEHKDTILSRYKLNYIQFYNIKLNKSQAQLIISLSWIIIIFVQITALLFTFSRSAWAGFMISIVVLVFLLYIKHFSNVSHETLLHITKNGKEKENYNSIIVSRETILNFKRKLNCYFLAIFVAFLFIGFFDHYFWTLQQGRLIFWFVLGMLLIDIRTLSKKT